MINFRNICKYEYPNLEKVLRNVPPCYQTSIYRKCGNGPGPKYYPILPSQDPYTISCQTIIDNIRRDDNTFVNGKKYQWVYPCIDIATRQVSTAQDVINEMPALIALLEKLMALQEICITRAKLSEVLRQLKREPTENWRRMERSYSAKIENLEKLL
jgi:hypothetical protein